MTTLYRSWRLTLTHDGDHVVGHADGGEDWRMTTRGATEEEVLARLRELVDEEEGADEFEAASELGWTTG